MEDKQLIYLKQNFLMDLDSDEDYTIDIDVLEESPKDKQNFLRENPLYLKGACRKLTSIANEANLTLELGFAATRALILGLIAYRLVCKFMLLFGSASVWTKCRDVVSWNSMLAGYALNERIDDALKICREMEEKSLPFFCILHLLVNKTRFFARRVVIDEPRDRVETTLKCLLIVFEALSRSCKHPKMHSSSSSSFALIDNNLVRGEEISPSLVKAIEHSKISIVVLSENYASFDWCLDELVKILDCLRFNRQMLKVQSWRSALTEVANLAGWDSSVTCQQLEKNQRVFDTFVSRRHKNSIFVPPTTGPLSQIAGCTNFVPARHMRWRAADLAAKALGGLLRGKPHSNVWIEVLRSKIWDLPDSGILPALRLSYHHLPSHLKRCFAHCAVLPKGSNFEWLDLVLLWMAEGLLQQSNTKKKMEDIGLEYFNELLSRSFFEESTDGSFVMHDLISDLAHIVAGETCLESVDDLGCSQWRADYDKFRHLTHMYWTEETSKNLEVLCKLKHLRTMVVRYDWNCGFTDVVLNTLIPELKCLRVLSLDGAYITQLPNSVCQLKHLRYLCLSLTCIKQLPGSVGELLHLQTLILNECKDLIALPQGIKNLINLRYLSLALTPSLQDMPAGLGNLGNLHQLSKFIVSKCDGLRLHELKNLSELQGRLIIQGLHYVMDIEDAKAANLKDKHGLNTLKMEWSYNFNDSRNERNETFVLDALQPPKNLEMLTIAFFGGSRFPIWLGDHSYLKLVQLDLGCCRNSTSLPSLGRLPLLRILSIEGAERVRTVGAEFYGHDLPSLKPFQSLEILRFKDMLNWEHWACSEINFPCLVQFELENCPKLIGELPQRLPSLQHLHIVACPMLKDSLRSLSSLHTLYTEYCNQAILGRVISFCSLTSLQLSRIAGLACLNKSLMQAVTVLEVLKVEDCSELSVLWEDGADVQMLASLKRLVVCKCPNLVSFATGHQGMPCNLEFLALEECNNLKTLPTDLHSITALGDLRIKCCPKLKFPATGLPNTLTYLRFGDLHEEDEDQFLMGREELYKTSDIAYDTFAVGTYQPSMNEGKMRICISDFRQVESLLPSIACNNIKHIFVRACLTMKCLGEFKHNLIHLRGLTIAGCVTKQRPTALSEWGLSSLTFLQRLDITGVPMVSFPDDDGHLLPTSLKHVSISCINNLKSISKGILNLTSIEHLQISHCYKLSSLPKEGLPVSLQRLDISYCSYLDQQCESEKGVYWSIISNIPERHIVNSHNDPNARGIQ
ncbi:uncharacterized protein LOC126661528 [Mercurialis annua]|uniref:uncharacterized protein LOC126661528 n=1 Tax=Mercurialis annua TaxID=3986 RepID=UPI00215F65C7|nr:uncharacterized protein LOC126661528 [Mercurialis annua]